MISKIELFLISVYLVYILQYIIRDKERDNCCEKGGEYTAIISITLLVFFWYLYRLVNRLYDKK